MNELLSRISQLHNKEIRVRDVEIERLKEENMKLREELSMAKGGSSRPVNVKKKPSRVSRKDVMEDEYLSGQRLGISVSMGKKNPILEMDGYKYHVQIKPVEGKTDYYSFRCGGKTSEKKNCRARIYGKRLSSGWWFQVRNKEHICVRN